MPGASWAGGCRTRFAPTWRSMRSSRPCTPAWCTLTMPWSTTATEEHNICPSATPSASPRPASSSRWERWRFVRQRLGRVHHRAVQDRGDSTPRPVAGPRSGGVRNPRVGRLVQQPPDPRADRRPTSGRGRSGVLSPNRAHGAGRVTHTKQSPEFPARFS